MEVSVKYHTWLSPQPYPTATERPPDIKSLLDFSMY